MACALLLLITDVVVERLSARFINLPNRRVLASEVMDPKRAAELRGLRQRLDPFELARAIDRKLERIGVLADRRENPPKPNPTSGSVTF